MGILRKFKSATLLEALVATILVVVIFVIASLVLNNILLNTFSKKIQMPSYRMSELEYELQNSKLSIPYSETFEGWEINIKKVKQDQYRIDEVIISAVNPETGRELIRKRIYEK